jgi:hypothetical protein
MHGRLRDRQWQYLEEQQFVNDPSGAAEHSIDELLAILHEIDDVAASARDLEPAKQPDDRPVKVGDPTSPFSRYDYARSLVVADRARIDRDVIVFRAEVLQGELVPWEDLPAWFEARMAQTPQLFESTVIAEVPLGDETSTLPTSARVGRVGAQMLMYAKRGQGGASRAVLPVHFGVMQRIYKLSNDLAIFYGWQPEDATTFLLTDIAPWIAPVWITTTADPIKDSVGHDWTRRIKLDLDPSVPPAEVATIYQQARIDAGYGSRRRLTNKHADLAALRSEMPNASSDQLRIEWNARHPDRREQYSFEQRRNFWRDVRRATARLLRPDAFHGNTPIESPEVRVTDAEFDSQIEAAMGSTDRQLSPPAVD